ncbi:glycerol-3-phosphate acyltransferase [Lentibacillus sp. N15]|uniref:glycerol-3-phosphate acyltransferase n=1 Tax=Lentibacillus songyuanensis TaxID=3136161 RepID=UPI0031BAA9F7
MISCLFRCVNGAYYVARRMAQQDIRELGSSNTGARNAGRVSGGTAFVYTVFIDAGCFSRALTGKKLIL